LRYFDVVGKPYYRAPECYVPKQKTVQITPPHGAKPGSVVFAPSACGGYLCDFKLPSTALLMHRCSAQPWGYTAAPADIFACGVCIFLMATCSPPWKQAKPSDLHFRFVHRQDISTLLHAWGRILPADLEQLLGTMLSSDPAERPRATTCVKHGCFADFRQELFPIVATTVDAQAATGEMSPKASPCSR